MKIYNQEKLDGLESVLKNNTILLNSVATNGNSGPISDELQKTIAGKRGEGRNFDLYFINSILVSANWNKNDHVWLPAELYGAKETPVNKKFNLYHNEKEIVGHIIGSQTLDVEGNHTDDPEKVYDILVNSVMYSQWDDPEYQEKIETIIDEIERGEWSVSMESLFFDFDYALKSSDNTTKVIAREDSTAFLTKHLRHFGGEGVFKNMRIGMVPRNFTFSGKGLVKDPANTRSVILVEEEDKKFVETIISKGHTIMEKEKNAREVELEKALAEANSKLEKLEAAKEQVVAKEINDLKKQNENLSAKVDELTALASEIKEDKDKLEKSYKEQLKDSTEKLEAANSIIKDMEVAKAVSERKAKLVAVNVDANKADELCKVWSGSTDEQFDSIVELYSKASVKTDTKDKVEEDEEEKVTAESLDLEEDLEEEENVNLAKAGVEDAETLSNLSKEVAAMIGVELK